MFEVTADSSELKRVMATARALELSAVLCFVAIVTVIAQQTGKRAVAQVV